MLRVDPNVSLLTQPRPQVWKLSFQKTKSKRVQMWPTWHRDLYHYSPSMAIISKRKETAVMKR